MLEVLPALVFPNISPELVSFGPFVIRWYALSYVAGILLGWVLVHRLNRLPPPVLTQKALDDIIIWAIFGIILGGRTGYVLFYNLPFYLDNPSDILKIWHGGMSFHGGLIGVILAIWLFSRRYGLQFWRVIDLMAVATPIGLGLGRIANFINAELFGHPTDVPWAVIFPTDPLGLPRHPSQLYEALLEGALLLAIMLFFVRKDSIRGKPGRLSGIFLIGYGCMRAFVELFRMPDIQLGYLAGYFTMGQILCLPMVLFGIYLLLRRPLAIVPIPEEKEGAAALPPAKGKRKAA
jgi:phosphatidylglycerol:prolipoprotein diacylglycerol transferase